VNVPLLTERRSLRADRADVRSYLWRIATLLVTLFHLASFSADGANVGLTALARMGQIRAIKTKLIRGSGLNRDGARIGI
jgi:hypothetical protein